MPTQYRCKNERRRILLRQITEQDGQPRLNGIDYIEVAADRQTLQVYFIHPLSTLSNADSGVSLQVDNLLITGGVQKETLGVESISVVSNLLRVRVDRTGDYSTYTLRLVQSSSQLLPPSGIDPQLVAVDFSFWVNEISELDCRPAEPSAEKASPSPAIDYLAKDYGSFRRLMLDRLAVTHPQWQERNPADVGIMLVELLAYGADHLSYYQDAVGTEAYLGTARRRISVRRHARMLDYFMHEGCNARAWVVLEILAKDEEPQEEGPKGEEARSHKSRFCEGLTLLGPDVEQNRSGVKCLSRTALPKGVFTDQEQFYLALSQGAQVFETLHDIVVYPSLNRVQFYTWGDEDCCLPKGAMQATLCDRNQNLCKYLKPNRVLIIEEVKGPESGDSRDA
ncbi:MAG: putative baseplate assembly protein, partial [Cyanobacteria bacterium P01_H01_bin.26]